MDGIKLHPLHIVKGSIMAKARKRAVMWYRTRRLYGDGGEMIRHTPPEIVYHRISASARRPTLLAPLWCENRWKGMLEINRYLQENGVQGRRLAARGFPATGDGRLADFPACRVLSGW